MSDWGTKWTAWKQASTWFRVVALLCSLVLAVGLFSQGGVNAALDFSISTPYGITSIKPDNAPNDLDTAVIIEGAGFVDGAVVRLGSTVLENSKIDSAAKISAVIPWGLEPGDYPLTVTLPDETVLSLDPAFTVSEGVNQWISGGPFGGVIYSLAIDPSDNMKIFAVMADPSAGLFASTDGGETWQLDYLETGFIPTLAIDRNNPKIIYTNKNNKGSLMRSDTGGMEWTPIPVVANPPGVTKAYVANDSTLFAAGYSDSADDEGCGLYSSTDNGDTWTTIWDMSCPDGVTAMAINPHDPTHYVIAATDEIIYEFFEGDLHPIGSIGYTPDNLLINPDYGTFAFGSANADSRLLYHFIGKGNWEQVVLDTEGGDDQNKVTALAVDPHDSAHMIAGTGFNGMWETTDGGSTWARYGSAFDDAENPGVYAIAIDQADANTVIQGGFSLYKTTDAGGAWAQSDDGLTGVVPEYIDASPDAPKIAFASTKSANALWTEDGGNTWLRIDIGDDGYGPVVFDPEDGQHIMLGYFENLIRVTTAGGQTWSSVTLPQPTGYADPDQYMVVTGFMTAVKGIPGRYILGGFVDDMTLLSDPTVATVIYTSEDNGATWSNTLVREIDEQPAPIPQIAYDPQAPATVYATIKDKEDDGKVFKSSDGGKTWAFASIAAPETISRLAVHPAAHTLIAAYGNAVIYSRDEAQTWEEAASLPVDANAPIKALAYTTDPSPTLYVGTRDGLVFTSDLQNWQTASGALGSVAVSAIKIAGSLDRGILYISTTGGLVSPPTAPSALGPAAAALADESLIAPGIYRFTTNLETFFLPLVRKN